MIYFSHHASWQSLVPASHGAKGGRCQRRSPAVLSLQAGTPRGREGRAGLAAPPCGVTAGQRPPNSVTPPSPVTRGHHSIGLWPHGWWGSLPSCYRVQILYGSYKTHNIIKLNDIWSSAHCLLHFCPLTRILFSSGNDAVIVLPFEWHTAIQTGN